MDNENDQPRKGVLSIVATPIGNLEDITLRAIRTLQEANVIYCEDTRMTGKLLARYEIETPLRRLDAKLEKLGAREIIDRLEGGEQVAYVTDAGTPGISDPGSLLVAIVRHGYPDAHIEAIPGPSALTAALSVVGVNVREFLFLGFLPHKKGRQTLLREIADTKRPVVLYESPHRILKLLTELEEHLSVRRHVTVARELTKTFEDVQTGTPAKVREYLEENKQARGEFVVIIAP